MIIIKLQGGLGNQMFQYAFGRALSIKFNSRLYLDLRSFQNQQKEDGFTPRQFELGIFPVFAQEASENLLTSFTSPKSKVSFLNRFRLFQKKTYIEPNSNYNPCVENLKPPIYLDGYWQSEKYFKSIEQNLRQEFTFKDSIDVLTKYYVDKIKKSNLSVSIHIRRGDYITSPKTNAYHGVCSLDYYEKAISIIISKYEKIEFYVFSDDNRWVKENFVKGRLNMTVIDHNTGRDSWKDMLLMSCCNHHIIANSSFSWWGAWLSPNENKTVIAPKRWFLHLEFDDTDIIPQEWIRI